MASDPQATTTLNQKTSRLTLIAAAILVAGFVLVAVLVMLTNNLLKKQQTLVQQKITTQQSVTGTASLISFVQSNLDQLKLILDIFPDEATIIETLQTLEVLVHAFDLDGKVNFSSATPVLRSNQLEIPVQIHLRTTPYNSLNLLRQLERTPYIIEIINYELKASPTSSAAAEVDLGVVLYVQDPFRSTN